MKGLILNNSILNTIGNSALNSRWGFLRNTAIIFLLATSLLLHAADCLINKLIYKR